MRFATLVLLLGCGSSATTPTDAQTSDVCTEPTTYLGVEHDCMGGAGVCIEQGPAVTCYTKCDVGGVVGCSAGFHWATRATADAEVCYCVANP